MNFSKKSRYGLRALIDLAANSKVEQVSLSSIAERNQISPQYLEQIFASLRRAGIVKGMKGPQGGYVLSRRPGRITVSEILNALEGTYLIEDEETVRKGETSASALAIQKLVIDQVNQQVDAILKKLTLEDLEQEVLSYQQEDQMYYI